MKYVAYDPADGRIRYYYEVNGPLSDAPAGLALHLLDPIRTKSVMTSHYVVGEALMPRPIMPLAGADPVATNQVWRLDGIPDGAEVVYPGGSVVVHDGFIEWTCAVPGEYEFRLTKFPYLDAVVYASITAP